MTVLDLFAGCGGLSYGLQQAGFKTVAAVESDKWAAETYRFNHPEVEVLNTRIEDLSDDFLRQEYGGRIDMVVGGPPCQGFSVSGKRQYGIYKPENRLVFEFIRVVQLVRPSLFLLENVRGLVSATIEGRTLALNVLLSDLEHLGYHVYSEVLQATEYGVPQYRSRVFVVGSMVRLDQPFPTATHGPGRRHPYLTVWDAISDLPYVEAGQGKDGPQAYAMPRQNGYQRRMRRGLKAVWNHQAMNHTRRLVARFAAIPPGGKGYDLGRNGNAGEQVTVYKSNNQRLVEDRPSLCIASYFQSNYVHPRLNRNLTAREAARIMSFPDRFIFKGKRTVPSSNLLKREGRELDDNLSQYRQIGNAVVPILAETIGANLARQMCGR